MTHFLLRLFARSKHTASTSEYRAAIGRGAGITGIVCNLLLAIVKMIAGVISGSIAIIADSVNNLSDAFSSVVTLIGFYMAQRPADKDHPFGHARYEYLTGFIIAELILLVGFELGKSSVKKIITPSATPFSTAVFVILVISIAVKIWMFVFFRKASSLIHSETLKAASADSKNDVIATSSVLFCCLLNKLLSINLDGYFGLAISVFIIFSGIGILRDMVSPILGKQADQDLVTDLTNLVESHDKVLGVHDLLIHDYGPGQCYASVHAEMDADEDAMACHDLLEHIESEAMDDMNVHLVIHYDPVVTNDEEWNQLRNQVVEIVSSIDTRLHIHDFRLVQCDNTAQLVFDLSVPYEYEQDDTALTVELRKRLMLKGITSPSVIHIDRTDE